MAELMRGAPVAKALGNELRERVSALARVGCVPCLAIMRVGENESDLSYERAAAKRCDALGIRVVKFSFSGDVLQAELVEAIGGINKDPSIHGCLLFRPLPAHIDEAAVCGALDAAKDVDGLTEGSLFGVFAGSAQGFAPCTAAAVMQLLEHYGVDLVGKNVAVVGRSLVVGKPVSMMLQAKDATVTMCHSKTRDLDAVCAAADVLVVAAGRAGVIKASAAREGQVVVDVGINWDAAAQRLVGDVAFDEVEPLVEAITPVPGGVGSVTTAILARHVVEAAERSVRTSGFLD